MTTTIYDPHRAALLRILDRLDVLHDAVESVRADVRDLLTLPAPSEEREQ